MWFSNHWLKNISTSKYYTFVPESPGRYIYSLQFMIQQKRKIVKVSSSKLSKKFDTIISRTFFILAGRSPIALVANQVLVVHPMREAPAVCEVVRPAGAHARWLAYFFLVAGGDAGRGSLSPPRCPPPHPLLLILPGLLFFPSLSLLGLLLLLLLLQLLLWLSCSNCSCCRV
jgi:hypothetical protein